MEIQDWVGVGGVPVVVALVQLAKPFVSDERFWPVLAVALGVVWNVIATVALGGSAPGEIARAGVLGVVVGLAAGGLYSGGRTLAGR